MEYILKEPGDTKNGIYFRRVEFKVQLLETNSSKRQRLGCKSNSVRNY